MAKIPRLQMSVLQPPFCHLPDCPISSGFVVRRSRQPRAVNIGQKMHGVHDLGVVSFFCADLLINIRIGCRLGLSSRKSNRYHESEEATGFTHWENLLHDVGVLLRTTSTLGADRSFVSEPQNSRFKSSPFYTPFGFPACSPIPLAHSTWVVQHTQPASSFAKLLGALACEQHFQVCVKRMLLPG